MLIGSHVHLSLYKNEDYVDLRQIAKQKTLWKHLSFKYRTEKDFKNYIKIKLIKTYNNELVLFTIFDNASSKPIGMTSLFNHDILNNSIEIGGTWISQEYWGTNANVESKLLLIDYCFIKLHINRIEIRTRMENVRCQKALEKIYATREGVLRENKKISSNDYSDTIVFSYINREWYFIKQRMEELIITKNKQSPTCH